ncbi:monovalent cation:proton antiporter-2 (CPA2) family protein [Piscinibacter sp.]|jgi:CPA2 family monovalent cation:H+ antiporter-2|uniref:monovalent cation:proton antiporter-2 (CPA2) family protein n=1 Tax=Piscinibacter sp. TaxID=1903157 RepID=UPI00355A64F8
MTDGQGFPFLRETLLFLALSGVLIPLLQRLRINQVLGFLAAGALLGPFGLAQWSDRAQWLAWITFPRLQGVSALAELGVLFLMFMIGLELSAERLWALRRWVVGAGIAQVVVSATLIGAIAFAFGNAWQASLILGFVLSLSSTAVVMQLLSERHALTTPMGQATFSVLMLQDLAVVPLLVLVGLLGRGTSEGLASLLALTLLKSAAAVLLIFVVGRRIIRPLFRTFAKHRQPEAFMALTLLATLSIAGLTAAAGLSMALGAFLAGLLLAETEFRHEVEVTIEPFKGLLMGLFFMSVGMGIDIREWARTPFWVPASVIGLIALKATVAAAILRAGGLGWGRAVDAGLLLGQGGEFAFIVVGSAAASGLLATSATQFVLLVVGLSMFVTPLAARWGALLGRRIDSAHGDTADEAGPQPLAGHIVIAGFGRVGQLLAELLTRQGVRFVALEQDAHVVARQREHGMPVYFGNAARPELLRKLHAGQAAAVVITMDQPAAALHAVTAIRGEYPQLPVFARSRDERHAQQLKQAGATLVIPETLETGLQLSASVLQTLGMPDAVVTQVVESERGLRIAAIAPRPGN